MGVLNLSFGSGLPLLEREADLAQLQDALAAVGDDGGRLVLIEGAAGTGKSRLLSAAVELAGARGLRVLQASGSELERDFAFGVVRQLFEPPVAAAAPKARQRLLAGAAAPARWVLGPAGDQQPDAVIVMLHALYWLAANLATDAPLLIAVEDLHWVDEASARALAYLARRLGDVPVLIVVTLRPHEPGSPEDALHELGARPGAVTLTPRPLTPAAVAALVRARLPSADDRLCAACHEVSAGNPLYLQELLRAVAASGIQSPAAVREASVPSLGDRVIRRIRQVSAAAPTLAGAMAVLGDRAPLALAAALAGLDEVTASRLARRLVRIEVLASEDPVAFVHPLIRRSVYDSLTSAELDDAHRTAARLLQDRAAPVEAVAAHLAAARPTGSAAVAATLLAASEEALGRATPEAAVRWLRRALAEEADPKGKALLLFRLGQAEMGVRDPNAAADLDAALALADGDDELYARVAVTLVELLCMSGRWEAGVAMGKAALARVGDQAELALELTAPYAAATAYDPRLAAEFEQDRGRLLGLAQGDSWPARALAGLLSAVAAVRDGDAAAAVALAEHSFADGRLLERNAGGWATAQVLWSLIAVDRLDEALTASEQVDAAGKRAGTLVGLFTGAVYRGSVYARRGQLADAEAVLRPLAAMAAESGMGMWVTTVYWLFIEALVERPSLADIAREVESLQLAPDFMATMSGAHLLEVRGRLRLAEGDREGAIADLRACGRVVAVVAPSPCLSAWRSHLALALPAADDEASALIEEKLALARATGVARTVGIALRAAGVRYGGAGGLDLLRESVEVLGPGDAALERARSLVELGAARRRAGQRAQAREPLADGLELAHWCGAERLAVRAAQELRAAGARPRRVARSGVGAFTASELRVARLAVRGLPNEAIAQELYVSRKTVETHLSHMYAKLGLSGQGAREALRDALAGH